MKPLSYLIATLLLSLPRMLDAQESALLMQTLDNGHRTVAEINTLAYKKRYSYKVLDQKGRLKFVRTESYDVIFLKSTEYERLVSINDKPLSHKQFQKESERQKQEELLRSRDSPGEQAAATGMQPVQAFSFGPRDRKSTSKPDVMIVPDLIPAGFRLIDKGAEKLNDREVQLIEAVPNAEPPVGSEAAKAMAHLTIELSIDIEDKQFARIRAAVTGDALSFPDKSTIEMYSRRLDLLQPEGCGIPGKAYCDRVWVRTLTRTVETIPGHRSQYKQETEVSYSNWHHFTSETELYYESPIDSKR